MKSFISKTLVLLTICSTLFAFTKPGGEGFEIALNGKIILQRFGSDVSTVKSLSLNSVTPEDKLTIKYHHCGRVGKKRMLTIKDEQNKTLKTFSYPDGSSSVSSMEIKMKELLNLEKTQRLQLVYTSTELPNGRTLVALNTMTNNLTKR